MKNLIILLCLIFLSNSLAMAADFSNNTIYFILVDRFNRGGSGAPPPPEIASPDHKEWKLYWGGDIKGITQKLPYIKDLGATALWLTPVFDNTRNLYIYKHGDSEEKISAYHGYWARDFKAMNPYFGTLEDYRTLIKEAHKLGIKVIFDMVLNHTSPVGQGCDGALYDGDKFIADYSHDPEGWFHHNGSIDFRKKEAKEWQDKNLYDLADLASENPKVANYLIEAGKFWVKQGIDGFRLDTVRHISPDFARQFSDAMLKANPKLWIFGEWSMGGLSNPEAVAFTRGTGINLIDFTLQSSLAEVFCKDQPFSKLVNYLKYDNKISHPENLITIIDNHDMPRFISTAIANGANEVEARKKTKAALCLLMTLRGIPCLYYGTEHFLHNETKTSWGVGGEPYNRQMMDNFTAGEAFCRAIKKLAELRRTNPATGKGKLTSLWLKPNTWVFEKKYNKNYILVAVNKSEPVKISITANKDWAGKLKLILGKPLTYNKGKALLELGPWEYAVYEK
jgi:glycosidase